MIVPMELCDVIEGQIVPRGRLEDNKMFRKFTKNPSERLGIIQAGSGVSTH